MDGHTEKPTLELQRRLGNGGYDLAIDLGTTTTFAYLRNGGIVLAEPSVVAMDKRTMEVRAIGHAARAMACRAPADIALVRPLRGEVVAHDYALKVLLASCLDRACSIPPRAPVDQPMDASLLEQHLVACTGQGGGIAPRLVLNVPTGATVSDKHAVQETVRNAGARTVYPIEAPLAAAIGAGLPIAEPSGVLIVDIGGGMTEVAVIVLGGSIVARAVPVAGDALDAAIQHFVQDRYDLQINGRMAEKAKLLAGSAYPLDPERTVVLRGRDVRTGFPRAEAVSSVELRAATDGVVREIAAAVRDVLEATPPELLPDLRERGIVLTGGGALLRGLPQRLSVETRLPARVVMTPTTAVLRGLGHLVDTLDAPAYPRLLEFSRPVWPLLQHTA